MWARGDDYLFDLVEAGFLLALAWVQSLASVAIANASAFGPPLLVVILVSMIERDYRGTAKGAHRSPSAWFALALAVVLFVNGWSR